MPSSPEACRTFLTRDRSQSVSGNVDVTKLSTLERDLLKDALAVVKQCKTFLRQHFRLDAL